MGQTTHQEYVFATFLQNLTDIDHSPSKYMGFAFLDRYDVDACAQQCNARGADGNGGACQYFNVWRAVVDGNPTTYTCSMVGIICPLLSKHS